WSAATASSAPAACCRLPNSRSPTSRSAPATARRSVSPKRPMPRCSWYRKKRRPSPWRATGSCTAISRRRRCAISCPGQSRTSKAANELPHQPADPPDCFTLGSGLFFAAMSFGALPERLAHVRAEIARRQAAAGRTDPVTIVAVTKGFGLEAVEAALAAGLADVGENRVQEALEKLDTPVGRRAKWHLVGHLQRNKAKHVAGRFALIHSVDSAELAEELDKRAGGGAAHGAKQRVLLQVNVAGETQKSGC